MGAKPLFSTFWFWFALLVPILMGLCLAVPVWREGRSD